MKRLIFTLSLFCLICTFCKKPEACVKASPTQAKLGQEVVFTDCSMGGDESKMDFGDGSKNKKISGDFIKYQYSNPGTYFAKLELYNKNDKKKDEAVVIITIDNPTSSELAGNWRLYQREESTMGFNDFYSMNELWTFMNGYFYVDGYNSYYFTLAGNTLATDHPDGNFRIIKLYNDNLILRYDEFNFMGVKYYSAYHFVKEP